MTTITWTWSFPKFETAPVADGLDDVVTVMHWRLRGEAADGLIAESGRFEVLPPPDPQTFTPFDDLTEAEALAWLADLVDIDVEKAAIAERIELKRNPPVVARAAPWA
ncbi:hypothetical protein [Stappia sp. ES.058]|uniref:DUF7936 family protein n=1 Tax=Stappia sp. ES.058 TaxID=1881061 RepID=UPI00087AD9A3|nr:hypothetical protein [Stappia sp. ES.058]SDT97247.1 hypothetical protein SAMN05428979_0824 [Stappia sp. ES.058]